MSGQTGSKGEGKQLASMEVLSASNNKNESPKGGNLQPASPGSGGSSVGARSTSSLEDLLREKCPFPIPENLQMMSLVWISRGLPCIAAFGCVIFIIVLLATPENWKTNRDATDAEVLNRESNRGLLVSVIIAILLNLMGALMCRFT